MTDTNEQAPARASQSRVRTPPAWAVLLAACAGQFLVVLDMSVVNVALPAIRADLGMAESGLQWVVNAYAITFAGLLLLGGRAADLFGRKRVFLAGLALFTAASLAGGLADGPGMLIAARAVQGIGAAVLSPATLTILTTAFPEGPARTRAIGTWTAVGAGGGAAGGLVGGLLTEHLSWRWVLLVNVPIGALVLVVAALWLAEGRSGSGRRLDVLGSVLVTGGVAALAYGIVQTEAHGWTSAASLVPLIGGLVLLAAFVAAEARVHEPLVPLGLFRIRSVSAANAILLICGPALMATWYFLSLYMQNVLHYSPVQAGLSFLPHTIAVIAGSKAAPRLMARFGPRTVAAAGALIATAALLWQATITADGTFLSVILGPGALTMLGAGLLMTPVSEAGVTGVAAADQGLVAGALNTSRQLGGALGLTVLATAAASRTGTGTGAEALTSGYALTFVLCAVFMAAGAAMVALLPRPGGTPGTTAA
ncbi:DHA2 family efflux MFS transporter permease subunit [Streptomyces coryli]|nr:DHA2 family efflux MFS transporter permease subunit [Streptomyces coryli]